MASANGDRRLRRIGLIGGVIGAAALGAHTASGQDGDAVDRTARDCVILANVDKTEVTDDRTILFYMRNRDVYRNYLPRRCPQLERQNRFSYETRGGQLCSTDTITVLEQWGGRLAPGFTCRLGEFHPISLEEAEDLERLSEENAGRRSPVDARPAEVPEAGDSADDGAAAAGAQDGAAAEEPELSRRERRRAERERRTDDDDR